MNSAGRLGLPLYLWSVLCLQKFMLLYNCWIARNSQGKKGCTDESQ
jgi:hypothetical protein